MNVFDIPQSKIGESAWRVVDRAIEEARRRDHVLLTTEHVFLAFAQVEWDAFSHAMRDLDLNPHQILQALEEQFQLVQTGSCGKLRVAPATKLVFKLAFCQATREGRQTIESSDVFSALCEERQGGPVSIIRRHGVEPEVVVARIAARMQDNELEAIARRRSRRRRTRQAATTEGGRRRSRRQAGKSNQAPPNGGRRTPDGAREAKTAEHAVFESISALIRRPGVGPLRRASHTAVAALLTAALLSAPHCSLRRGSQLAKDCVTLSQHSDSGSQVLSVCPGKDVETTGRSR